jgi:hypothetical protein
LLVRSKDGESWALKAMVTRQLLVREEAIAAGYRWAGMGDRLLIPQGYDANRMTGQRGMFYLYQVYMEEYDDDGNLPSADPVHRPGRQRPDQGGRRLGVERGRARPLRRVGHRRPVLGLLRRDVAL